MTHRLLFAVFLCSLLQTGCRHLSPEEGEQDSLIRAGDRVQAAGDSSSAINVYKSALEKNTAHKFPVYLKLGEAYVAAGQLEEAKKTYESALPFDENDEIKKQLGRLYLSMGQADAAVPIFEGIIANHKDDIKAYNGLGVAYDLKGQHPLAQENYHKALSINEENSEIKSNLGLSLAFEGKYEEALKYLKPIGERLEATSKQRHNLALVYALAADHSKAQEILSKDMGPMEIHENLHLLSKVAKPPIPYKHPRKDETKVIKESTPISQEEEGILAE